MKSGIDSIFGVDAASLFLIEANLRFGCCVGVAKRAI